MDFQNIDCQPLTVYLAIAIVLTLISFFFNMGSLNIKDICGQFLGILFCSVIIYLLCRVNKKLAWGLLILIILFHVCSITSMISMLFGVVGGVAGSTLAMQQ